MKNQANPAKKKILLHVGLHKTASTYIQHMLAQSNESLKKQGWNYPIYSDGGGNDLINHSNLLYTLFSEEIDSYIPNIQSGANDQDLLKVFQRTLKAELESNYNLILSGEDVSALSLESLYNLAKVLEPYDVTIIAFVREAYSYLCSNLQHRIHRGVHGLKLEVPNISQNCIRLKKVFPNIQFFSYERVKSKKDGLISVFEDLCEISINKSRENFLINESLGNKTIRFLAEFNMHYPLIDSNKKLNHNRPVFNVKRIDFDPQKFLLTKSEYISIAKQIRQENRNLRSCTKLTMIRTVRPIPLSDESNLTWNEAIKLLIKTSTMPSALGHRALIYVLEQDFGLRLYQIIRPSLTFFTIKYNLNRFITKLFSKSKY